MFGIRKRREDKIQQAANKAAEAVLKSIDTKDPRLAALFRGEKRNELSNPYQQIPNIYAVINAVARRVARLPIRFYRPGTDNEILNNPVIERLNSPAPNIDKTKFFEALVINKEISGEWFIYKDPEMRRGVPESLWIYPATKYTPKYSGGGALVGFEVRPDGRDPFIATWDEILFDRYYNPWDDVRGLAPLTAARISIDTEYSARRYNKKFFDNDASPGQTYTTDQKLTEQQYERLKADLITNRQGVDNSHIGLILDGGLKTETAGVSQKDIQFIEQFNLTLQDVCAVFGVDPAIIGHEEMSKYASVKEARRYFWTDKVIPVAESIADALNNKLLSDLNIELRFDYSQVEALNDVVLDKADAAHKYAQLGYTRNEINERLGLGFPNLPEHDEPAPFALPRQPVQNAVRDVTSSPERVIDTAKYLVDGTQQGKSEDLIKAIRAAKWKKADAKVRPAIGKMNKRLRTYFYEVKQKLLNQVVKDGVPLVTKDEHREEYNIDIDNAFNEEKLRRIFEEYILSGAMLGYGDATETALENQLPEKIRSLVQTRGRRVKEVVNNAREEVRRGVQDAISEAFENQLTEKETAELLVEKLSGKIDNVRNRSRTIARTEVHSAFNEGRHTGMDESEPLYHRWISSRDANVRDSHDWLDGEKVPWGEPFSNGLMYPGDQNGSAEEVINCRCIEEPVYEGEE